ncbi:MAG: methyltransferase domain-containing protein [Calditrichaeota bacterium]|nr:methyltransferase domain-containing protein [Calditrichota bacterium]MCB9369804.1 methyltransferase domain-containing protein [Calditrichota bacterium]
MIRPLRAIARYLFSFRTRRILQFELFKLRPKLFGPRKQRVPAHSRLHLGCGTRKLPGWVNVDLSGADVNIDLAIRPFPFTSESFESVVSQHVVEHLDVEDEVFPVLSEIFRVLKPGGEFWVSTPDMEKLCRDYVETGGKKLHEYVMWRDPLSLPEGAPERFVLNRMFHQRGEHKNLFDFELLKWALEKAGFTSVTRVNEEDLLARFPDFPPRNDEIELLAVKCVKP